MYRETIELLIKMSSNISYEIDVLRKQHTEHLGEMPIHIYLAYSNKMSKLKAASRATNSLISVLVDFD